MEYRAEQNYSQLIEVNLRSTKISVKVSGRILPKHDH